MNHNETAKDNYADQVGPQNVSLYSDTIFTDRDGTGRKGRRPSVEMDANQCKCNMHPFEFPKLFLLS